MTTQGNRCRIGLAYSNNVLNSGEPFTGDELEEMLAAATDLTKGKIVYREYVVLLTSYEDII